MNLNEFLDQLKTIPKPNKTFRAYNFGCRVNAAEINLLSQILLESGFTPAKVNPGVILVNTCSVTKKGDVESIGKVRSLHQQEPKSSIYVTGCAALKKVQGLDHVFIFDNKDKELILDEYNCAYTPKIGDKFSNTKKYLLRIQSGCTQFCSYCIVPYKRQYLWSLPIDKAVEMVNKAVADGYQELIITGVNLDQYSYRFSKLLKHILIDTDIKKISFGSVPINCITESFLSLYTQFPGRLNTFLHIPIQSGSNKILRLMKRPYTKNKIIRAFELCRQHVHDMEFGTDIIVGFPGETDKEFNETLELCRQLRIKKIHTFRFSPRPGTLARFYYDKYPKTSKEILKSRSQQIRSLVI